MKFKKYRSIEITDEDLGSHQVYCSPELQVEEYCKNIPDPGRSFVRRALLSSVRETLLKLELETLKNALSFPETK